jgi:hypothetical protein
MIWNSGQEEEEEETYVYVQQRRKPEVGAGISSVPRSAEERSIRREVEDNDADNCSGGGGGGGGVMCV